MKKKHRILAALLLIFLAMSLSGCVMVETEVTIGEDGSVRSDDSLYYSSEYFEMVGETPEEFFKNQGAKPAEITKKQVLGTDYYGTLLVSQSRPAPEKGVKNGVSQSGDNWTVTYSTSGSRKLATFTFTAAPADSPENGQTYEGADEDLLISRVVVSFPGGVKSVEAKEGCRANISGRAAIFEISLSEGEQTVSATGYLDRKEETDERLKKLAESNPFSDVSENDSYFDAVVWGYNSEPLITDGNGAGLFMPAKDCTRGQVVTFLWRALGCPEPKKTDNPFTDVTPDDYFYKPVLWALENGVTDGVTETTFGPYQTCRHSHVLTFLHRAVKKPDPAKASELWYEDALKWAQSCGMTQKTGVSMENVTEGCLRSDIILYLYSCFGNTK